MSILIVILGIIVILLAIIAVAANCYSNVVNRRVKRDLEKLQEDVRQYFILDDVVEEAKEQDHINNIQ
jgi:Na+-transporting methylmalonyl-CoA/oxaloacetate decarboxylase gamma subunit